MKQKLQRRAQLYGIEDFNGSYRDPTPVNFPVNHPNGVLRLPPLEPDGPNERGLEEAYDSFLFREACCTADFEINWEGLVQKDTHQLHQSLLHLSPIPNHLVLVLIEYDGPVNNMH
jgi:hypothetical protein